MEKTVSTFNHYISEFEVLDDDGFPELYHINSHIKQGENLNTLCDIRIFEIIVTPIINPILN